MTKTYITKANFIKIALVFFIFSKFKTAKKKLLILLSSF